MIAELKTGKPWTKEENERFIDLKRKGKSHFEISKILNRDYGAVENHSCVLIRKGLLLPNFRRWSRKEDSTLIKLRNSGIPYSEIATTLNKTEDVIQAHVRYLMKKGIIKPPTQKEYSIRRINSIIKHKTEKGMKIMSRIVPNYWLGYLIGVLVGDGTYSKSGGYITLETIDFEFNTKFKKSVKEVFDSDTKDRTYIRKRIGVQFKNGKYEGKFYSSSFYNKYLLIEFDKEFGPFFCFEWFIPVEKYIKYGKEFIRGFVGGFFDSEGCIYFNKNPKSKEWRIIFSSYNDRGLSGVKSLLEYLGYSSIKIYTNSSNGEHSLYVTNKQEILNFISEIEISIPRKIKKFKEAEIFIKNKLNINYL